MNDKVETEIRKKKMQLETLRIVHDSFNGDSVGLFGVKEIWRIKDNLAESIRKIEDDLRLLVKLKPEPQE